MSKYDDVQQFKKKINMKDIDYKEFPKDDGSSALHRWSIVEQVAEAGNGIASGIERSMQPTPVSASEFSSTPSPNVHRPVQSNVAPTQNPSAPKYFPHDFNQTIPPAPERSRVEAQVVTPAPQPSQALDTQRFKRMFSKKTVSAGEAVSTGRNALLKPLLEIIASCR